MKRLSPPVRTARLSAVLAPAALAGAMLLAHAPVPSAAAQSQPAEPAPGQEAKPEEKPTETTSYRGRRRVLLHSERYEREFAVPKGEVGGLRVEGANGSVRIIATDRSTIGVNALVDAMTRERALDAGPILDERGEERWLVLRIDWPEEREQPEAVSWEIEVPRTLAGFDVETTGGVVSLEGLAGAALVRTTVGDVLIADQGGGVDAETSNARILVDRPGGDVVARTSNAMIRVHGAAGAVDARTRAGAIDVRLRPESPGPVRLESEQGAVELVVGRAFTGTLQLRTDGAEALVDPSIDGSMIDRASAGAADIRFGEGPISFARTTGAGVVVRRR